jgi:hypothetical protein
VTHAESRLVKSTHGAGAGRNRIGGASSGQMASTCGDGSGARATRLLLGAVALLGLLTLAVGAAPASAALKHSVFSAEFGNDGTAATTFAGGIRNIGFAEGSKRVIVGMGGASNVHSITVNSPGSFTPAVLPFTANLGPTNDSDIAVSSGPGATAGYIYTVPSSGTYTAWTPAGVEAGAFNAGGEICGLAVDNQGNVWAGNYGSFSIEEYPPGGSDSASFSFGTNSIGQVCKLTVDPVTQDVYALKYSNGPLYKYSAATGYEEIAQYFGTGNLRMDINAAKHVLYVTNNTSTIFAIDTNTGVTLEEIKPGGSYRGIAVDESTDTLYGFSTTVNRVREIPLVLVPKALTGEPLGNRKVSGTVAPDGAGNITECAFEWGTSATNYNKPPVPCEQATPITTETAVTAELPEGEALVETEYHYRVRAATATPGAVNFGVDEKIKPHYVPALKTEAASAIARTSAQLNASFDGNGEETEYQFEWGEGKIGQGPLTESSGFLNAGSPVTHTALNFVATGLTAGTTYHFRVVAESALGESIGYEREFTAAPAVSNLETEDATDIDTSSATLHGSFDIDAEGGDTHYYFQYGLSESYGSVAPVGSPPGADAGSTPGHPSVQQTIEVNPGTTYHFRVAASNSFGTTFGADKSFKAPNTPTIVSVTSANVTASTADLSAKINPEGYETTYRFEYGTTPAYGNVVAIPNGVVGSGEETVLVSEHIADLEIGATYHFRVIAENQWGESASGDQTFAFFTANCPNAHLRQESGAAYLPDCRAYELVSPEVAGAVQLFPGQGLGPIVNEFIPHPQPSNTGMAGSPPRFTFWGGIGQLAGTNPPNITQDLYLSTRTPNGWESHYPGIAADTSFASGGTHCSDDMALCENYDVADPLETSVEDTGSNAPHVFDANGNSVEVGRFPTMVDEIPGGEEFAGQGIASGDYTHFGFGSNDVAFAPGGLESAPGSAYDNDVAANTATVISKLPGGADIPQDPQGCNNESGKQRQCVDEFVRVQGLSTDGSHILMSTWADPLSGSFANQIIFADAFKRRDVHLYMHTPLVDYDITEGHRAHLIAMDRAGSRVYFTSDEQLTLGDTDESVDLYMWDEASGDVSLLSIGAGAGNGDECTVTWAAKCSVQTVDATIDRFEAGEEEIYTPDNWTSQQGEVYFYSPEQLDGNKGFANQRNIYVYRNGAPQYVTTLTAGNPAARMNVAPDGDHMAFVTAAPNVTGYDNQGSRQMYLYEPDSERMTCVSCDPTGNPPSGSAAAAQNGRFMSDDGRSFFSTKASLVPFDTNGKVDVYEYTEGRPQLISSGTASTDTWGGGLLIYPSMTVGLEAVSADGLDVYFSTFATLVPQDQNGEFIKFYDARTGGGFPFVPPPPGCKAADECHGSGSVGPASPQVGTVAPLGGSGNVRPQKKCKKNQVKKHGKCVKKKKCKKNQVKKHGKCVKKKGKGKKKRAHKRHRSRANG